MNKVSQSVKYAVLLNTWYITAASGLSNLSMFDISRAFIWFTHDLWSEMSWDAVKQCKWALGGDAVRAVVNHTLQNIW